VIRLLIPLGLDDFAAGLAYGLAGLPRARSFTTALIFSFFGVLLPLLGIVSGRWLSVAFGAAVAYLAGGFLIVTGLRGIGDVFLSGADKGGAESSVPLDPQAVALAGLVVAIATLAVGLALGVTPGRPAPLLGYLAVQGFVAVLLGLAFGGRVGAQLGRKAAGLAAALFVVYGIFLVLQTAFADASG
jgi:putative Mn2+ efflux pump MntP